MDIPVKSATYAMKGRQILQRNGIRVSTGKKAGSGGCVYNIKVSERDAEEAWRILRDHGIIH